MRRWRRSGQPVEPQGGRYDELMARHQELRMEIQCRIDAHMAELHQQLPLGTGAEGAGGASTGGIRLAPDGALDARLELQDWHGQVETVVLRADPGGHVQEVTRPEPPPDDPRPPAAGDECEERLARVTELARQHLPAAAADDFLASLKPALRLEHAGESDPVMAQLGGLPTLPINSWPVWNGHGPLSHVLSFDCAPVAEQLPELGLPANGRLAFFYFDGHYDNHESTVGCWDPSTHAGVRVLHLHPERSTRAHLTDAATPAPPGLTVFPTVALTAVRTVTWPSYETPAMDETWTRHGLAGPRPGVPAPPVAALYDALWKLPGGGYDTHQIGGHPCPQQGPVEMEVEQVRCGLAGEVFDWKDAALSGAASGWNLLLQVASDGAADMMWGDVGQLYYLAIDSSRPEESFFTWQCG